MTPVDDCVKRALDKRRVTVKQTRVAVCGRDEWKANMASGEKLHGLVDPWQDCGCT